MEPISRTEMAPRLERVEDRVRRLAQRHGPIPFSTYMDEALYGDGGFYAGGGGAGRRRDFLTSPEVGPLFGAVIARAIDAWWHELGRPDPFVVAECGPGPGTLCRAVLHAKPACLASLRYLLVERSPSMRAAHHSKLPIVRPADLFGAAEHRTDNDGDRDGDRDGDGDGDWDGEETSFVPGQGPLVASLEFFPSMRFTGVVLANELLDNLAFDVCERTPEGWAEVRVGEDLAPLIVPAEPHLAGFCNRAAPHAAIGARIPIQRAAARWLRESLDTLHRGRVVVLDYASSTEVMAARRWTDWLRTYRDHEAGGDPFTAPGRQDITSELAVDQLAAVRAPDADRSQAEFLKAHGLDDLVAEGRRVWHERAAIGDLAAITARSRIGEAEALTDPRGLGRFRVLEWYV